jgi:hypothetical protein
VPIEPDEAIAFGDEVRPGLVLERSEPASSSLLADLRSDKGMRWLPSDGVWLTYLRVDAGAGELTYDLAIDASGAGQPSPVAAGLDPVATGADGLGPAVWVAMGLIAAFVLVGELERRRSHRPAF